MEVFALLCRHKNKIFLISSTVLLLIMVIHDVWSTERLVSLKPNITDILLRLGLGEQIVGVTRFCDIPGKTESVQRVADYVHVNVERVMALKPTRVLGSQENSLKKEIEFLERSGLEIHLFPFGRLSEIRSSIEEIADLLGVAPQGRVILERFQSSLAPLRGIAKRRLTHRRTLMVVGVSPLMVVGSDNLLNDLLEWIGLENVARGSALRYPSFSRERLIASQPDIIIDLSMGTEKRFREKGMDLYQRTPSLPAVLAGRIYFLDMADFLPSTHLSIGAQRLVEALLN